MMKPLGIALFIAGILLHLSVCDWKGPGAYPSRARIVAIFYARDQFSYREGKATDAPIRYNVTAAAFWGLVVPTLMIGAGIGLTRRKRRYGDPCIRDGSLNHSSSAGRYGESQEHR